MKLMAYTDGACRVSNPGLCSCAFVVYEGENERFRHGRFLGTPFTNNYAEYMGVIMLLEWAEEVGLESLEIWCDSKLVVNQVNCEWQVKPHMQELCSRAFGLLHKTKSSLKHLRGHAGTLGNETADEICNEILDAAQGKAPNTLSKS